MAEFIGGNEEYISAREPIVFENKTECKFEVCAGVVFHKSGVYEVSVAGNRTIVSEVPKRKTGKWIIQDNPGTGWYRITCSECGEDVTSEAPTIGFMPECKVLWDYCPMCGTDMREGEGER